MKKKFFFIGFLLAAAGAKAQPGNYCTFPTNPMTGDYEIPFNTFNYHFTDPTSGALNDNENFVLIGNWCFNIPRAKLDVIRNQTNNSLTTVIGSYFENHDVATAPFNGSAYGSYHTANGQNVGNHGVYGQSMNAINNVGVTGFENDIFVPGASTALNNTGVHGFASEAMTNRGVIGSAVTSNTSTLFNMAGYFRADGSLVGAPLQGNYGVYSVAGNSSVTAGNDNVGVLSYAFNNGSITNNVGVAGISTNFGTATNDIGVYGETTLGTGFAMYSFGPNISGPQVVFSDSKLKKEVKPVENATELLNKLKPVTYFYKTDEYPSLGAASQLQYGFIAQEIEQVIPELVTKTIKPEFKDNDGKIISKGGEFKGVNYDGIIAILAQGFQEQQAIIEKQSARIDELEARLNKPGKQETGSLPVHETQVELSNTVSIVLEQNVPNPFAEQTTIQYTLDASVKKAQMLFYNAEGKLINSVDLNDLGQARLNVFASDLTNGIYTYTLVADGKIIDSKRMIRNK